MEKYSMIEEFTDSYVVKDKPDKSIEISIQIPARFKYLWLFRLSELKANDKEIKEYEEYDDE